MSDISSGLGGGARPHVDGGESGIPAVLALTRLKLTLGNQCQKFKALEVCLLCLTRMAQGLSQAKDEDSKVAGRQQQALVNNLQKSTPRRSVSVTDMLADRAPRGGRQVGTAAAAHGEPD